MWLFDIPRQAAMESKLPKVLPSSARSTTSFQHNFIISKICRGITQCTSSRFHSCQHYFYIILKIFRGDFNALLLKKILLSAKIIIYSDSDLLSINHISAWWPSIGIFYFYSSCQTQFINSIFKWCLTWMTRKAIDSSVKFTALLVLKELNNAASANDPYAGWDKWSRNYLK